MNIYKKKLFPLLLISTLLLAVSVTIYSFNKPKSIETGLADLSGDCDTNGVVNIIDFQLLSNSFGKSSGQSGYNSNCDFNTDNTINILDFQILSNNFGRTAPTVTLIQSPPVSPTRPPTSSPTATPNPNSTAWYVDSQAVGSGNGTSWQNAWRSFANINFNSMKSGDVLYISGGSTSKTYSGTITIPPGTAGITITKGNVSGHNGEVVIDGQGSGSAIRINATSSAVSNILISNLTFKAHSQSISADGEGSGGIRGLTIDNVKILDFKRAGIFIDGYGNMAGNRNIVVKNSYLNDDNAYTSQSDGIYLQVVTDFTADHNTIILDNNYTGASDLHSDNIQAYYVKNVIYSNNYVVQRSNKTLGTQLLFTEEAAVGDNSGVHNFVNNVLIRDCPNAQDGAIRLKIGKGTTFRANIIGNTYYGRSGRIVNSSVPSTIKNNIFYSTGSGGLTYSNSDFSNNLITNPNFVNPSFTSPDLHLQPGSPAINSGANLSALGSLFTTDVEGKSRDSAWDIGAYEY